MLPSGMLTKPLVKFRLVLLVSIPCADSKSARGASNAQRRVPIRDLSRSKTTQDIYQGESRSLDPIRVTGISISMYPKSPIEVVTFAMLTLSSRIP
ncbi:hypothetical protein EV356DRAFT_497579 [Viridothelium virens]|uniref:Secreted protein n=1 Tax=Viridothelium virens TaxID=1048519 RepID=A0A6A6HF97_VIRVR|nr:hypothetical protein EV356DRAFT_497579 [Viridothelium virens]